MICIFILCIYQIASSSGSHTAGLNSLQNRRIKVVAEPWKPFFVYYCDGKEMSWDENCHDQGLVTYGGALWDLLKFIKQSRNVTFSMLRAPDYEWGVCYGKNNCTGMIGVVNRREADFAIGIVILEN